MGLREGLGFGFWQSPAQNEGRILGLDVGVTKALWLVEIFRLKVVKIVQSIYSIRWVNPYPAMGTRD